MSEELNKLQLKIQQIPLLERLDQCTKIVERICREGRPLKMSIPAQATDEDMLLIQTLEDAKDKLRSQL